MEAAGPRSLVLLDEPAAGTDPDEGSRLAQAVIERLVEQGALVLATTHHPEVKAWASAAPARGQRGRRPWTCAPSGPLYTLQIGEPGASHALGIAEGLGLDPAVVEAARTARVRPSGVPWRRCSPTRPRPARRPRRSARRPAAAREQAEAARAAGRARGRADLERRDRARARGGRGRARRRAGARPGPSWAGCTREPGRPARRRSRPRAGRRPAAPPRRRRRPTERARERDRRLGAASRAAARAARERAGPGDRPRRWGAGPSRWRWATWSSTRRWASGAGCWRSTGGRAEVQGGSARMRLPARAPGARPRGRRGAGAGAPSHRHRPRSSGAGGDARDRRARPPRRGDAGDRARADRRRGDRRAPAGAGDPRARHRGAARGGARASSRVIRWWSAPSPPRPTRVGTARRSPTSATPEPGRAKARSARDRQLLDVAQHADREGPWCGRPRPSGARRRCRPASPACGTSIDAASRERGTALKVETRMAS